MKIDLIKNKAIYLTFSGLLVLVSLILVIVFGFRPGIDLAGGTEWQLRFDRYVEPEAVIKALRENFSDLNNVSIRNRGEAMVLRLPVLSESGHQEYLSFLENKFGSVAEGSFASVGPTIGRELLRKSVWALFFVIVAISLYIAWAFRKVSRAISSWKYGLITMATLFHDVSIPAGLFAFLGWRLGLEIDTNFIVALLVVMGFSVHDTIVVFDRIRENILRSNLSRTTLKEIINKSVSETFVRSVNTSFTLFLVLAGLMIFGPASLFYFLLTILVGTIFGTYSSIFVASPLLYLWRPRQTSKE